MNAPFLRTFSLAGLIAVLGCSDSSSAPSSGPSAAPPTAPVTTSAKAKFAYTGNEGASLSGYAVNTTTGALTALSGFPMAFGTNPTTITHDPQNRFLIVGDIASFQVSSFAIDSTTGGLTKISTLPLQEPVAAAVSPDGTHVYVLSAAINGFVSTFNLSSAGVLTASATAPAGTGDGDYPLALVALNAAGTFLYTANSTSVSAFSVNTATGALTLLQQVKGLSFSDAVVLDPAGKFLYVQNSGANMILSYSVDASAGTLTLASTSPLSGGGDYSLAVSPSGKYGYAIGGSTLVSYSISNGVFTSIGVQQNLFGLAITVDPSGSFVYVPQACSQNCPGGVYNVVNEFAIGSTGAVTKIAGSPVVAGVTPTGITITAQ